MTLAVDPGTVVSPGELARRLIRRSDFVSCDQAFIDCRTPGSELKQTYSIIGPGVAQGPGQFLNLAEPHGFNVGAAAMPHGITNNLHLRFTAEVLLNFRGRWLTRWGRQAVDGEHLLEPGDILSVPPWVFRGFTNVGGDDGWLFTVLGFDDTGGIIWAPSVLAEAANHGLYLSAAGTLVEAAPGQTPDPGVELVRPLDSHELASLRRIGAEQMRARVCRLDEVEFSSTAFLCSALAGGRAELGLVIGYGMTEERWRAPRLADPHNFNLAWLRARSGQGLLCHRHGESQVVIVYSGRWLVELNRGNERRTVELGPDDMISVPAGAWRRFEAVAPGPGDERALLVCVNGGDGRTVIEWDEDVVEAAVLAGVCRDAAGYLAPAAALQRRRSSP